VALVAVLTVLVAAATVAVAVTIGSGRTDPESHRWHGRPHSMMSAPRGWSDLGPGMRGSMRNWMSAAATTEFDYLAEMVAHHSEAVAAAEELRRSERPQLRAFADSVIETQSAEIEQMNRWLAQWYPGRSTEMDYRPMMRNLSGLSGESLDRAFLTDMIGHHMMAVMMSQMLLARGVADHQQVNELARSIRDEQHSEILQMREWLADWFGGAFTGGTGWGMGMMR